MGKNDIIILVCLLVVFMCLRTENLSISLGLGQVKLDKKMFMVDFIFPESTVVLACHYVGVVEIWFTVLYAQSWLVCFLCCCTNHFGMNPTTLKSSEGQSSFHKNLNQQNIFSKCHFHFLRRW